MNILITGTSGFVGLNLIHYFKNIIGLNTFSLSMRDINWDKTDFNKFDVIIHLAGKAHDTSNSSDPESYFEINRDLTIKLFNKFISSTAKDFIFFSSVKAVSDSVTDILTEEDVPNPQTPYGKSKLEAENYLLSHNLDEDKRLFILRPCMIHGPGNKGNLNLLYNVVKKNIPWPLSSFKNERSFLSIENLSFLVYKIIENRELKSSIYNLSDDEYVSTNMLVELISKVLDKNIRFYQINPNLIRNLVKIGDVIPFPINSERLKKLTESYRVSNNKIKFDLNLIKLPISSLDGLKKTIESFK